MLRLINFHIKIYVTPLNFCLRFSSWLIFLFLTRNTLGNNIALTSYRSQGWPTGRNLSLSLLPLFYLPLFISLSVFLCLFPLLSHFPTFPYSLLLISLTLFLTFKIYIFLSLSFFLSFFSFFLPLKM